MMNLYNIEFSEDAKKKMRRMSKSSFDLLNCCEAKFVFERGLGIEPDAVDNTSLVFGSALHHVMELTKGMTTRLDNLDSIINEAVKLHAVPEPWIGAIHVLVGMYPIFMADARKEGIKTIACEVKIGDGEDDIGYVDAIEMDPTGAWVIVDYKTTSKGYLKEVEKSATMHRNLQLNFYAANAETIVKEVKKSTGIELDVAKFAGVSLRFGMKPSKKYLMDVGETIEAYTYRASKYMEWSDIFMPATELDPESAMEELRKGQERAIDLAEGRVVPRRSRERCFDYNRPCEFFSQCYGKRFDEAASSTKAVVSIGFLKPFAAPSAPMLHTAKEAVEPVKPTEEKKTRKSSSSVEKRQLKKKEEVAELDFCADDFV